MSKMIDYLKAAGGEASLLTRLGFWRQAVSLTVDQLVDLVQLISGGGLLPATGTTQGSRPLSGYNTALLQTGDEVFVQGINEVYYFDATSVLAADGLNVVNAVGPGQFIRSSSVIVPRQALRRASSAQQQGRTSVWGELVLQRRLGRN